MKIKKHNKRGFTLMEILIVVAILAILGGASWEAFSAVENTKLRKRAEMDIAALVEGMNAYRVDNAGNCPYATGNEASSNILYRTLYCDHDNNGEPDKIGGVTQMPYCPSLAPILDPKASDILDGIRCYRARLNGSKGKNFAIFDPWDKPYRYRLGYELTSENGQAGGGVNPDFDIFSLGPDGLGDGLSNDGDNKDNISNIVNWD